ncbi:MAG: hypothetical protein U0V87_08150 [Acidobacteriota bacterium]
MCDAPTRISGSVLVIGLGLIGQLTWMLLEDAGLTIGTDVSAHTARDGAGPGLEARKLVRGQDDVEGTCSTHGGSRRRCRHYHRAGQEQ